MTKQNNNQNIKNQLKKIEKRLEKIEKLLKTISPIKNLKNSLAEKDELTDQAIKIVSQYKRVSASLLQRRLSIGYARAARILDFLEQKGIVSPAVGSEPRKVLLKNK